jgi:hypothetical protein
MSLGAFADNTGLLPLDCNHRYRLRLPARMPVGAIWSLSIYTAQPTADSTLQKSPSIGMRSAIAHPGCD